MKKLHGTKRGILFRDRSRGRKIKHLRPRSTPCLKVLLVNRSLAEDNKQGSERAAGLLVRVMSILSGRQPRELSPLNS
jgi:hypothetical protein